MSADKALSEKSFNDAGGKVNTEKWYMSPATVNAYYNPKVGIKNVLDFCCHGRVETGAKKTSTVYPTEL